MNNLEYIDLYQVYNFYGIHPHKSHYYPITFIMAMCLALIVNTIYYRHVNCN